MCIMAPLSVHFSIYIYIHLYIYISVVTIHSRRRHSSRRRSKRLQAIFKSTSLSGMEISRESKPSKTRQRSDAAQSSTQIFSRQIADLHLCLVLACLHECLPVSRICVDRGMICHCRRRQHLQRLLLQKPRRRGATIQLCRRGWMPWKRVTRRT